MSLHLVTTADIFVEDKFLQLFEDSFVCRLIATSSTLKEKGLETAKILNISITKIASQRTHPRIVIVVTRNSNEELLLHRDILTLTQQNASRYSHAGKSEFPFT